jgi:hypothetical protein
MFEKYNLDAFLTGRATEEESRAIREALEADDSELRHLFAASGNVLDPERVSALMALVDEDGEAYTNSEEYDKAAGEEVPIPRSTRRGWVRLAVAGVIIALAAGIGGLVVVMVRRGDQIAENHRPRSKADLTAPQAIGAKPKEEADYSNNIAINPLNKNNGQDPLRPPPDPPKPYP